MNDQQAASAVNAFIGRVIAKALQLGPVRAYLRYSEHNGPKLADSITYRALFSVFAAVLLGFSFAALWLSGNPDAMDTLTSALDALVPGVTRVVDLRAIDAPVGFTLVGIISLLGLVGAAIGAIGSLRSALHTLTERVSNDGNFVGALLRNLLVAALLGGLLLAAAVLSVGGSVGVQAILSWLGLPPESVFAMVLTRILFLFVVFAMDSAAVALMFRLLSGVNVNGSVLWRGAMLGGAGLIILQQFSALFVRGAAANPLLASFAALIALLLWLNLSAQVILLASSYIVVAMAESADRVRERFGAETLAQYRRRRAEERVQLAVDELHAAQAAEKEERDG